MAFGRRHSRRRRAEAATTGDRAAHDAPALGPSTTVTSAATWHGQRRTSPLARAPAPSPSRSSAPVLRRSASTGGDPTWLRKGTRRSVGDPPEGGGIAAGDQDHDPASPLCSPQPRPGFGAPNLALGCPCSCGARLTVLRLSRVRRSPLVPVLECPRGPPGQPTCDGAAAARPAGMARGAVAPSGAGQRRRHGRPVPGCPGQPTDHGVQDF